MKTRYIIGAIIACIAVSLYLRIALPYDHIFTTEWVKFSGVDAYWLMSNVDKIAPDFPAYLTQIFKTPFFIWLLSGIIWCIGLGSPTQHTIDTIGVYFPTILAALTVIPVYFISKAMFGRMAGIIAASLIAILPGEWLGRSILGFTDHHVMGVLLSTTAIMFFVMAFKAGGKRRIAHTVLSALFMGLYLLTFKGGVLFVAIIGAFLCCKVVLDIVCHQKDTYFLTLLALGIIIAVVVGIVKPGLFSDMARYVVAISGNTGLTTIEMRPLFYPRGTFTLDLVWGNFGFVALLAPMALAVLIYRAVKSRHSSTVLLIVWSIVTLVLMLQYRRFAYYFAVNASLLTGWFIWYAWQYLKEKSLVYATVATAILLAIMIIPNAQHAVAAAKHPPYTPPDAWCEALEWVEENTAEDSVVLSWWDYGYWIKRMAHRKAYVNPSQDNVLVTNTARMFLSGESVEADYIILDYATTGGKFWAVATWAGNQPSEFFDTYYVVRGGKVTPVLFFYPEYYQNLAVRLYNFGGKAVTSTQSTVISSNERHLVSVDTYATYEEAVSHVDLRQRLVGASPFKSPIPLDAVGGYVLIYESEQKINGVSEVKVFKRDKQSTTP